MPRRFKQPFALLLSVLSAVGTLPAAFRVLANGGEEVFRLPFYFWGGSPFELHVDTLSAFFMVLINVVTFTALIYAGGYLRKYVAKPALEIALHLTMFVASKTAGCSSPWLAAVSSFCWCGK